MQFSQNIPSAKQALLLGLLVFTNIWTNYEPMIEEI